MYIDELIKARTLLVYIDKELGEIPGYKIIDAINALDEQIERLRTKSGFSDEKRPLSNKRQKGMASEYNRFQRMLKSAFSKIALEMFDYKIEDDSRNYVNKFLKLFTPVFWYLESSKELFNTTLTYVNTHVGVVYNVEREYVIKMICIEIIERHFNFIQKYGLTILQKRL